MPGPSVKIDAPWFDLDSTEDLGTDGVVLLLAALAYCATQSSDGRISGTRLRRLWPAIDNPDVVSRLIKAGELSESGEDEFLIIHWEEFILSAEYVDKQREQWKTRQKISRDNAKRAQLHGEGDHSMCDRCAVVKAHARGDHSQCGDHQWTDGVTRDTHRDSIGDSDRESLPSYPTRPYPTRPLGRGGEEEGRAPSRPASPGSAGAPPVDPATWRYGPPAEVIARGIVVNIEEFEE